MAANTNDRLLSVDKLTENNWPVWKLQISKYLQARELWPLCIGDEIELANGANDAALAAYAQQLSRYQVRVARVKSIVLQMVSASRLHVIAQQRLQTPRDMWQELVDTFERPSLSNKLQLQTRLLDLRMKPSASVDEYIKHVKDITERLAVLGAPAESNLQVAFILRGLPSEFDALRVALVTKGDVSMSELREALRIEEHRLFPNAGSVGVSGVSALSVRSMGNTQQHNSYASSRIKQLKGPPGSCYGCGRMGHIHCNCPTNPYVPSSKQKQKATLRHKVKAADCSIDNTISDNANDDNCDCDDVGDVMFTVSHTITTTV